MKLLRVGAWAALIFRRWAGSTRTTFDRPELDSLERRELQLAILAAVIVLVLAGGVVLLIYPLVFVHAIEANKWSLRVTFIGFCALSLLFVGYLLDQHRTVRRLKQKLLKEHQRNVKLRDQGNVELLHSLPDLNRFQDCVAMEYRRAASSEGALSLLLVKLKLSPGELDSDAGRGALGEAARAISGKLRPTDSVYQFGPGLFGVIFPNTNTANAKQISLRLQEALRAAGGRGLFTFEVLLYNYPENVTSAHELQQAVSSLLSEKQRLEQATVTP
jgi:GGDEF domain-containing protein